jgi:hypothetical protein
VEDLSRNLNEGRLQVKLTHHAVEVAYSTRMFVLQEMGKGWDHIIIVYKG